MNQGYEGLFRDDYRQSLEYRDHDDKDADADYGVKLIIIGMEKSREVRVLHVIIKTNAESR